MSVQIKRMKILQCEKLREIEMNKRRETRVEKGKRWTEEIYE
jgi:hypothetical protein